MEGNKRRPPRKGIRDEAAERFRLEIARDGVFRQLAAENQRLRAELDQAQSDIVEALRLIEEFQSRVDIAERDARHWQSVADESWQLLQEAKKKVARLEAELQPSEAKPKRKKRKERRNDFSIF